MDWIDLFSIIFLGFFSIISILFNLHLKENLKERRSKNNMTSEYGIFYIIFRYLFSLMAIGTGTMLVSIIVNLFYNNFIC